MPRYPAKQSQIIRCIELLLALARAKRGVGLKQFADKRGWGKRAAYRDIEALEAAGVPIIHEHGWYRVPENWVPAATVDVSRDELLALFVACHFAPGLKQTCLGQPLERVWSKLAAPSDRQQQLALGDESWVHSDQRALIAYSSHAAAIASLGEAIREQRAVRLRYRKTDGSESDRVIEPAFVYWVPELATLYLRGWCRQRGALRTFAIQRIVSLVVTDDCFQRRLDAAPTSAATAFRSWISDRIHHVTIRFARSVAGELRERTVHASQRITEAPDGAIDLDLDIAEPDELVRWLVGYGPDATVLGPASLAAKIRDRHAASLEVPNAASLTPLAAPGERRHGAKRSSPIGVIAAARRRVRQRRAG